MDRVQKALDLFYVGYNCSQSVFAAFSDLFGIPEQQALLLSSGFGAGMGGLREKCGAVTGMFLLAGIAHDGYDRTDIQSKKELYDWIKQLDQEFTQKMGTTCCRELLTNAKCLVKENPSERDEKYYQKRPCALFVETAAKMVQEHLLPHLKEEKA